MRLHYKLDDRQPNKAIAYIARSGEGRISHASSDPSSLCDRRKSTSFPGFVRDASASRCDASIDAIILYGMENGTRLV